VIRLDMRNQSTLKVTSAFCGVFMVGALLSFAATNEKPATVIAGSGMAQATAITPNPTNTVQATNATAAIPLLSAKESAPGWISRLTESNLVASLVGLFGGVVGFIIARHFDKRAKRQSSITNTALLGVTVTRTTRRRSPFHVGSPAKS
jgi:capsular polysaccharide biosynthesis protein